MNIRKRKFLIAVAIVISLTVGILFVLPPILYHISQPRALHSSNKELVHYVEDYESSQNRFISYESVFKKRWTNTKLEAIPLQGIPNANIDIIKADSNKTPKNLIFLTAGMHGIEGYAGSAMLDVIEKEYLSKMNPDDTGIIMVHCANPWGMKNKRRYNESNVDLNRNFIYDWSHFDKNTNRDYAKWKSFLQPTGALGNLSLHEGGFYGSLVTGIATKGTDSLRKALLTGQYTQPKGVYYGGTKDEASTTILKQLYNDILSSNYENIVHIDLHTGYGPRYQMSIFSSINETMTEKEAQQAFHYPLVLTPSSDDYYVTNGDNTEYFYKLQQDKYPAKKLYTTTFEFGTMGTDTLGSVQSAKHTVDENRLFWCGSSSKWTRDTVHNRYVEMFYPHEEKWRLKAIHDFKQAFEGVLYYKDIMEKS